MCQCYAWVAESCITVAQTININNMKTVKAAATAVVFLCHCPITICSCFQIGLAIFGIITVVAVVNYWLLIPTFFVGIIFYLLRNVYLSTSRSVKRLEGLSKCTDRSLFTHYNEDLDIHLLHGLQQWSPK